MTSLNSVWHKIFKNKEIIILIIVSLFGAFLRFYRLTDLMTYFGDEGRDMLIIMDIVKGINFPLIGPPTSIADLYLGPIYYYFIAPFAWAFKMSPIGPAVFVVLLGIFSIPLIYFVAKKYFNNITGIFAAIFLAFSPLTVRFSRASWNPNPMPFFSLLSLLFLYYFYQTKKNKFLYLATVCFGVMLQLHYLAILLIPFLLFIVLRIKKKANKKPLLISLIIFILLLSPLFIFDLKHDFVNIRGFIIISKNRSVEGFNFIDLLSRSRDRLRQLFSIFLGITERGWQNNLIITIAIGVIIFDWLKQKSYLKTIIYGWFIWGIISLGLYRHSVYPHYLGFLFIFPALLLGYIISLFFYKSKFLKFIGLLLVMIFVFQIIKTTWKDLSRPAVINIKVVQQVVKLIQKESNNEPFNFALLANNNYDDSYRYYFKLWNLPASYKTEVTKQLFVVCEDEKNCQPEGNPKWEIALFDAAYNGKIDRIDEWQPNPLVKIFKFLPSE